MSRIGIYNMEVEEELRKQLNYLGFSTLQEALTNGYSIGVVPGEKASLTLVKDADQAYTEAHEAWLKEKEEVLSILHSLKFDIDFAELEQTITDEYHAMIDKVINFIEGGEK